MSSINLSIHLSIYLPTYLSIRRRPSSGRNKAEYRHVGSGRLDTCGSRRSSEARAWTTTLPSTWAGGQARSSTHGLRLRPRWHRAPGRQASGTSLRASRLLWRLGDVWGITQTSPKRQRSTSTNHSSVSLQSMCSLVSAGPCEMRPRTMPPSPWTKAVEPYIRYIST